MQDRKGNPGQSQKSEQNQQQTRIVSMRAWKARKRLRNMKGTRSWPRLTVSVIATVLAASSLVLALMSYVSSGFQVQSIILSWLTATVGSAMAIVMYVYRDRLSLRLLSVCGLSMIASIIAGLIKLFVAGY